MRRPLTLLPFAALLAAASWLLAVPPLDAATLRGRVLDERTLAPIEGALVRVLECGRAMRTGPDGAFAFAGLAPGRWTISARHLAHAETERPVTLAATGSDTELRLDAAVHRLEEIVVRSLRGDARSSRTPWALSTLVPADGEGGGALPAADRIAGLPGVELVRDGAWQANVSIRGMSRNSIVSLVDHTRIETAQDLAGALSLVNDADLERVEVLRTPGSVLFGGGALGGAVQLVTKRAPFADASAWRFEAGEGYASVNDAVTHHAAVEHSSARAALRASGSLRDAGLTATPRGDLPNSQWRDWTGAVSASARTFGAQTLFASWQRAQAEDAGISGGSAIAATATATYKLAKRERFALEYALPNAARTLPLVTLRVAHQEIARNVEIVQSPTVTVTPHATHRTASAQAEAKWAPSNAHTFTLGLEAWRRALDSRRERRLAAQNRVVGERPVPLARHASAGAYAQDDWELVPDRVRVTLGTRADLSRTHADRTLQPEYVLVGGVPQVPVPGQFVMWNASDVHDASWDATAGLHAQLTPRLGARVLVASAYRTPSLEERYQYLDLGGTLRVGNPGLAPERGLTTNYGATWRSEGTTIEADVFFHSLADLVAETPGLFEGRSAWVKANIGRARLYGGECSIEQRLGSRFGLDAALSQVRGEDLRAHAALTQVPPLTGHVGLAADARTAGTWRLECVAADAQRHPGPGELVTAGWSVWNAGWASPPWRAARSVVRVRAGVTNLFDRAYRLHLSTLRGTVALEPGRGAHAALTVELP